MCVRTKTSYGCGHVYKSTNDCFASDCRGVDRYHYEKSWDCRDCKSEGASISRGRDGKGRYAQKIKRSRRDRNNSSSEETLSTGYDVSGGASPWAAPTKQEKTWESPHRKLADDAWVSEHEDRIMDLNDRFEKCKVSEEHSRPTYTKELVIANSEHVDYDDYDQDGYVYTSSTPSKKQARIEGPRHLTNRINRSNSNRNQDRQHSYDSLPDSIPSYRSSPRPRQGSTFNAVNAYPDASHDYDYYNSPSACKPTKHHTRHQHTPSRSKMEIYHPRQSYPHDTDYEILPAPPPPPPPLQIPSPIPGAYDMYDYYSPGGSPPGASYTITDYPYDMNYPPPPHTQHYVRYGRY